MTGFFICYEAWGIAYRLIAACSRKFFCPGSMQHAENFARQATTFPHRRRLKNETAARMQPAPFILALSARRGATTAAGNTVCCP